METPLRNSGKENSLVYTNRNESGSSPFTAPETPFLKQLGYGTGIGVYHLDRNLMMGRSPKSPWAIKKVLRTHTDNEDYGSRLHYEASLLQNMHHPNIVGFRGFTRTKDGREVLAMEECTKSLGDMIEDRCIDNSKNVYTAEEISKVCYSVANALDYLHNEVMLMHGDIKSYNILINGNFEEIKLCDFGVSVKVNRRGKALDFYVGTPIWSAPEALTNEHVTTKADIFSLGLVIYEMLALRSPNCNESTIDDYDPEMSYVSYIGDHEYGVRLKLPEIELGDEYNKILDLYNMCTEEDPTKRPSARDIVALLKDE